MKVSGQFSPIIHSEGSVASKKQIRDTWDRDFFINHRRFAAEIADEIASLFLTELKEALENGYKSTPTQIKPLTRDFSLEMTQKRDAKRISEWVEVDQNLPPFKEWLDVFSKGNDLEFDVPYFDNKTSILVEEVARDLALIFRDYMRRHKDLNFQVSSGLTILYTLFNFSLAVKTNSISIKAWPIEIDSLQSERLKALQEHQPRAKILKNYKTAFVVAIVGAIAMYVLAQSYKNIMH
ncbi:MAG: hypothetical protein LLG04_16535 [Parachlamydia sp.]|nr:hypothetical protein [Parachlamydia sp.]